MGTNYYAIRRVDKCPHCKRPAVEERLHIGKSSAGWVFKLRMHEDLGILDWEQWKTFLYQTEGITIVDEYGTVVPLPVLSSVVTQRTTTVRRSEAKPIGYNSWHDFHGYNNSTFGINGLLRDRSLPDTGKCWECVEGEFG